MKKYEMPEIEVEVFHIGEIMDADEGKELPEEQVDGYIYSLIRKIGQ